MSNLSYYIALSGIETDRVALATTANDISNANTPGFERETPAISTVNALDPLGIGGGADVTSILQDSNSFLQAASWQANADVANLTARQQQLSGIQNIFQEPSSTGLSSQLSTFWNAWDAVAQNPSSPAPRAALIGDAQNVAQTLNQFSSQLNAMSSQTANQMDTTAGLVNNLLSQAASLNQQITSASAGGSQANSLIDQRNQVIQQLAQDIGITARTASNGSDTLSVGGVTLVQDNVADTVLVKTNPITGAISLQSQNSGATLPVSSGTLAGLLAAHNTDFPNYLNQINGVASDIANLVNTQLAAGYYDNGGTWTAGIPMFLNSSSGLATGITAANIEVSPTIVSNPVDIAASDTSTLPNATNDGNNAQTIATFYNSSSGPDQAYRALIEGLGAQVQGVNSQMATQQGVQSAATASLQAATGVSTDQEMIKTLQYQQAYQASAKVIVAVSTALQSLLAAV